ncbi:MAG: SH3 domain-containing protein [Thiomicrospira sp.]|nr:SH3 domain-containing protein [Thiomicrospira sp.]NCP57020.1 SH3 domain-containing protein [Thiomicrospira sp.]NCS63434.1 SH3 domain-containing protein [Thiomicrospira sp.]PIQ06434.1 MAG: hypothetical protein COW74_00635 [Piscirickettsiaceae bacterium CG18_big_fil_WC_8_21_14_2_50_44_103]
MKNRPLKYFFSLLPSLMLVSLTVQAAPQYISSNKAKVLKEPNFQADLVAELVKGDQVNVLDQQGVWLNVSVEKKTGWVSKFLVRETPTNDRVTVLPGDDQTELKDVRRRASAITTAAAARGLAATARAEASGDIVANLEGVRYMESFSVSSQELEQFSQPLVGGR